jgi:hypothetical protein
MPQSKGFVFSHLQGMSHAEIIERKGVLQRLRLKFVARREPVVLPRGETAACLEENSFVGGVRASSLIEALDDGVDSEFSDELLIFACLEDTAGAAEPLAGRFDTGWSNAGSGRACFFPTAIGADDIGEGAVALNSGGDAV